MKNKPDYKGFCEHVSALKSISMNDLIRLSNKYNTPIPKEIITKGYCRRDYLIHSLVGIWRVAENKYLSTGKDNLKIQAKKIQDRLHLNQHEIALLQTECNSLGI